MTEAQGDESLQLRELAVEQGWNLVYSRKMTGPEDDGTPDFMTRWFVERKPTEIVKAKLFEGDAGAPFFFWVSSESDIATVLQEVANYLESPNPDDLGIQRANRVRERYKDVKLAGVSPTGRRIWMVSSDEPLEG